MVQVLTSDGIPLSPCRNVIARSLLKDGQARVVSMCPFTVRLNDKTTRYIKKPIKKARTNK